MTSVKLPRADGGLETYTLRNAPLAVRANGAPPRLNRIAYAAAHVVANPLADNEASPTPALLAAEIDAPPTSVMRTLIE